MYFIAEIVFSFLLSLLWWVLLYPVVLLVSTPFILILALFQKRPYRLAVAEMFQRVGCFWKEWGVLIVP